MPRPLISFGDALRVSHELKPDEAASHAIMEMLGLTVECVTPAPTNVGAAKPSSTDHASTAQRTAPGATTEPSGQPHPSAKWSQLLHRLWSPQEASAVSTAPPEPSTRPARASRVTKLEGEATFQPPTWLDGAEPLGELEPDVANPEVEPLFDRVHRRGILTEAVATFVEDGPLDFDAIVATLATQMPLHQLPRSLSRTTRRGVQVLLDHGKGMAPYRQDQAHLVDALDDVLGDEHFEVYSFVGCPSRGIYPATVQAHADRRRPARSPQPWKPPPPGTPLLAVTDLGIGGPFFDTDRATVAEWLSFADRARHAGFTLIALIPYQAVRWPPRVARAMTPLHWSEKATAAEFRRAMRDATQRLR